MIETMEEYIADLEGQLSACRQENTKLVTDNMVAAEVAESMTSAPTWFTDMAAMLSLRFRFQPQCGGAVANEVTHFVRFMNEVAEAVDELVQLDGHVVRLDDSWDSVTLVSGLTNGSPDLTRLATMSLNLLDKVQNPPYECCSCQRV
jgi:hypothetical protein